MNLRSYDGHCGAKDSNWRMCGRFQQDFLQRCRPILIEQMSWASFAANSNQLKTKWRKRVRVESAHKRRSNTLASSRWHIKQSFRYSSAGTAGKQQGGTGILS